MGLDLLPSSRPTTVLTTKRLVNRGTAGMWEPIYCANCGVDGGLVPEGAGFAFVLCDACALKHGIPAGVMAVPEEEFWRFAHEAQMEEFGRVLTEAEMLAELSNPDSRMSKVANDGQRIIQSSRG